MPDIQINVEVAGADQAAEDLKNIGNAAKDTGSDIKSAGSDISSTTQSLSSFKSNLAGVIGSFTAVSSGVLNIVRSFEQLQQSQIRLDQANKRVEDSANKLEAAQRKLNDAINKYGPGSTQAAAAAEKVKSAQEGLQIATDRAELQQSKFNTTLAEFATNVVPNVIGVFGSIVGAISSFTTKGEQGVSLAGKLKQSFLDLVSGGSGVKNSLDTAGTAMGGLGTKAEAAGKSAGTLESEVVQLGAGVSQAVPNLGRFTGGITNTAVAAERTAGPLGNIERSVASTAAEVAGAVTPLGAFAGGMGAAGTAAEGAVGGVEAAAVATGALETGSAAAAAESVGLATAVTGVSVGLAAETAGISLAIAALVAYMLNIGGFKDKTDAAVGSAVKFLSLGWESFTKKFEPVTKAIDNALKGLDALANHPFAVSGQFGKQPAPGLAPGPSGRPLDETINAETGAMAKGTAGILNMVNAFKQLAEQRTQQEGLSKTGVANSNANAAAFAQEQQALQGLTSTTTENAAALQRNEAAAKSAEAAMKLIGQAMKTAGEAMTNEKTQTDLVNKAMADFDSQITKNNATIESYNRILGNAANQEKLHLQAVQEVEIKLKAEAIALDKNAQSLQAMDAALQTGVPQQQAWTKGMQDQEAALQQSILSLNQSAGALQVYNQQIQSGLPQLIAFQQGIIDYNKGLDDTIVKTNQTLGVFQGFINNLATGREQVVNFNKGFVDGLADVQKWAEGIDQAKGSLEGTRAGLEIVAQLWGVELPKGLALSNEQLQQWLGIIHGAPAELDKLDQQVGKAFDDVVKQFDKLRDATNQKDLFKGMADNFKEQIEKFGGLLPPVVNKIASEMSTLEDTVQTAIHRIGAEIGTAKFTVGPIQTQALQAAQTEFQNLANFLNNQFAGALRDIAPKFQPLISQITTFAAQHPGIEGLEKAMGLLNVVMAAAKAPTTAAGDAILKAGAAAQGFTIAVDPATGQLKLYSGAAQTAAPNAKELATQSKNLGDQVLDMKKALEQLPAVIDNVFSNAFLQAIGKVTSAMAGLVQSINEQFKQGLATAGSGIDAQFVQPFLTGIGKITSAMAGLTESINLQLQQGLATAGSGIDIQFVQPFLTGIGKITQGMAGLVESIQGQVSAISVALNQAFSKGAQDAAGSINSLTTHVQTAIQNMSSAVNAIAIVFNTQFAKGAQDAAGSVNSLVTHVQTAIQNMSSAINAIAVVFNTAFQKGAQDAAGSINSLVTHVQTAMQTIAQLATIHVTADTGAAASAIDTLGNQHLTPLTSHQWIIQITANTGPAASAIDVLGNQHLTPLTSHQWIIQITANTGPAASAIDTLGNQHLTPLTSHQWIIQITANTGPAASAIQQLQNTVSQLVNRQYTITITANTGPAASAINALQAQLNALRASGTATGIPLGFARTGGLFELTGGGFRRKKRGDELHAAMGGAFIVTKETKLGNLTVGEGGKPELLQFTRAKTGRGIGMLMVTPIKAPRIPTHLHAQAGGLFTPGAPNLAGGPMGFIPAGGFEQSGGAPIEYPAGTMAPVQTVGQGGPQQGMPSTEGAGTILVGPGGQAQPGPVTAPPGGGPGGGIGGLIPGAPSTGNYQILPQTGLPQEFPAGTQAPVAPGGIAQTQVVPSSGASDVSPYEMAQMTGQAVADQQAPQQTQMQNDMADLLSAVRRLISKITMRDINANLVVDGQKMATTVSRYIGSNAYGGR